MLLRLVDSEYFTTHRHSQLVWFTECDDNSENQSSSTICIAGDSNRRIVFDRLHGYLYKLLIQIKSIRCRLKGSKGKTKDKIATPKLTLLLFLCSI